MAKVITYECKECGCEIVVSSTHESHLRPIYCCGVEVSDVSEASKTRPVKKKTVKAAAKRAVGKTPAKSGASRTKKAPVRKTGGKK